MLEEIIQIIKEEGKNADKTILTEDTELDDIMDSLEKINAVLRIEDKYTIAIPDGDIDNFKTIKDIVNFVGSMVR